MNTKKDVDRGVGISESKFTQTREKLLQCARRIISEEGIDRLTMDRLAQESGMSKGGVMYQFKTRKGLIAALLAEYAQHMQSMLERALQPYEQKSQSSLIEAYLDWYIGFEKENHGWARIGIILWDEQANNPELLAPVRQWYLNLFKRLEKFPPEKQGRALLAIMALEGFFCLHKFGLDVMSNDLKGKAFDELRREFPIDLKKSE